MQSATAPKHPMNPIPPAEDHGTLVDRIRQDLLDGYDEELELEIEDRQIGRAHV